MGTAIISTSHGRDDRPRSARWRESAARSWRGSGRRNVANRQGTDPAPVRRDDRDRARRGAREGPQGRALGAHPARHQVEQPVRTARPSSSSSPGPPTATSIAPCTASRARLSRTWCSGVTEGFQKQLEIQGVGYRAQLAGTTSSSPWATRTRCPITAPDGIEFEVAAAHTVVVEGALQAARRRDRRVHPQAAPSPSPTRARGSGTRASTWPGRSASER